MMFDYDSPAARAKYRTFKSRLTRLTNAKDHAGLIALWAEFKAFYNDHDFPMPDDWRRWERAAEDAKYELARMAADGWATW
jgi:hypothetical protein